MKEYRIRDSKEWRDKLLQRARLFDYEVKLAGFSDAELIDAGFRRDGASWRIES